MGNNIMQLFLYVWYKINIRKRRDIGISFEIIEKFILPFPVPVLCQKCIFVY